MSNRNLTILGLVTVLIAAWAVVQPRISQRPYVSAKTGSYLIQGLDPDQIASIIIGSASPQPKAASSEQVILTRRGANFVAAGMDNYPASADEINKLISTCLDIQTSELYTDNPANHKDLGVTEEDAKIVVKFYKADSSLLAGVIIGKSAGQGRMGGYVRLVSDNKVYLTTAQIPWIKKRAIDYVKQELTSVKREDINSVTVSYPDETYLLRPEDDKTIVLDNLPEGKKLKKDMAELVFTALANLKFEDVNAESSRGNLKFDRRYICRLKDSTVYTFWLAKDANKWLARCDTQFADKTPVTKTQGEVEPEDQLRQKETKLLARDAAEEFSEKHKGWVYRIPNYSAENMTKPLAELVEDLKPAEKQKQPADGTAQAEPGEPADENAPPADE
ncbi:MAG: DUF4340 domain-containing protein [Sedimentisphaerales bacterium]|jgi:hypothetical protein